MATFLLPWILSSSSFFKYGIYFLKIVYCVLEREEGIGRERTNDVRVQHWLAASYTIPTRNGACNRACALD